MTSNQNRKMHDGQADTDPDLVRRLLRAQFPQWADLPIRALHSGGTVNAVYRLGRSYTVRLPLLEGGMGAVDLEARWLPRLAPLLPVPIPEVVALGRPGEGYPWRWTVHRWIDGENLVEGAGTADPEAERATARALASFVTALRKVDLPGGPPAHRSAPLHTQAEETREALEALRGTDEPFDVDALHGHWEAASRAPRWAGPPVWSHSDLMPSNLLAARGRLTAVIDFGTLGMADPAVDLIAAWNLLSPEGRRVFREGVDVDDATWARGRGWALSMAAIQLPYYRLTNPVISANARYVMAAILAED